MQYDAVVLAGGENTGALREVAPYDNEALIMIGQHPMVYYVIQALKQSACVNKIVISGPVEPLQQALQEDKEIFYVEGGKNAIESFSRATHLLKEMNISSSVLVMPVDIPFITPEAIDDFISRSESTEGDFFYAVTRQEVNEKKFPGVARTYVKLKDGIFTGGNLFLVKSSMIDEALDMAVKLVERRKDPIAMGRLFGLQLVWNYFLKRLSIEMAERRFHKVLGIRGKAVISEYAEVGVDVDKPSDFELAQKYFSGEA